MTIYELLQAGDSSLAIVGALVAVGFWLKSARSKALEAQYRYVAEQWTNEGDVSGSKGPYVHLALTLEHGEIFGSFQANEIAERYEAHYYPGWLYGKLAITELRGRSLLPIIEFRVRLRGNNNRIQLKALRSQAVVGIPTEIILWPVPRAARNDA